MYKVLAEEDENFGWELRYVLVLLSFVAAHFIITAVFICHSGSIHAVSRFQTRRTREFYKRL